MSHELEIIGQAIDKLLTDGRAKRDADKIKQYGGKVKTAFYASELGDGERKLVYRWFADRIGELTPKTGQNIRVFDNGDYVHLRYRDYMNRMGALLSEEQPVKGGQADLEQIAEDANPYPISGRYDQIIDLNVVKAYLEGIEVWERFLLDNYEAHGIITTTTDNKTGEVLESKEEVRWVPKEGYEPDRVILDIKSQNEWGFNRVEKGDMGDIQGYFDQLSYYEHKTGIHKGALVIEDKSKQRLKVVPVDYDPSRILGDDMQEGLAGRLRRIWSHVENKTVPEERCAGANRNKFPCMWSTGQCDFYAHCWNEEHNGLVIPGEEPAPELPTIEELIEYLTDAEYGVSAVVLFLKDFPGGQEKAVLQGNMPQPMIEQMLEYYADFVTDLEYLDDKGQRIQTTADEEATEEEETEDERIDNMMGSLVDGVPQEGESEDSADPTLYNTDGSLNMNEVEKQAVERVRADGDKEVTCPKCQFLVVYKKCYGGIKPCPRCAHKIPVVRP